MVALTLLVLLGLQGWQFEANRRHRKSQREALARAIADVRTTVARLEGVRVIRAVDRH